MRKKKSKDDDEQAKPPKSGSRPKRRPVTPRATEAETFAPGAEPLAAGADAPVAAAAEPLIVNEPADGARKLLQTRVTFRGTATDPVTAVRAVAKSAGGGTETELFIQPVNEQGRWEHDREFTQGGDRALRVEGLDENGAVVATVNLGIHLFRGLDGYRPPDDALEVLGNIVGLLEGAANVKPPDHFEGGSHLFKLPGGQLYMVSDLDVDTDGVGPSHGDRNHQTQTSLSKTVGNEDFMNADVDAYFVLNSTFARRFGMKLGDVAAVVFEGRLAFALYADNQDTKVGEGSMALHAALGRTDVDPNRDGLPPGSIIMILFPGSRARPGTGYRKPDKVREVAQAAFDRLAQG